MIVVGLTGAIASGKSTVSSMIQKFGIPLICADSLAHEALSPTKPLSKKVVRVFGHQILNADGSINRDVLGRIVFSNSTKRKALEEIVHPWVTDQIKRGIRNHRHRGTTLLFLDIPLLFESGLDQLCDLIVVVFAPEEILKKRLASRDSLSPREINSRLASQMPLREKRRLADKVINNSGSIKNTQSQVRELIKTLTADSSSPISR